MPPTAQTGTRKSTNGRFFSTPRAVRIGFAVLERAAPGWGARWAEHIWFTLPRSATPTAGPATADGGRPFAILVDGCTVRGESWGRGPVVYLLHGWAGHRGQLDRFVPPLVAAGHRVVAFDAPSHGRSEPGRYGRRSSAIPEFAAALSAVVAAHGPAYAIVAHSVGATAAALALSTGLRAERVVMLAPMASPASYARYFATVLGFGERTLRHLTARVERRVGVPMHSFDVPELGRAIAMPSALVIHDRQDGSIPVSDGAAIAAAWDAARLQITTGLGHRRLLRDAAVVAEVVDFLTEARAGAGQPAASGGSGTDAGGRAAPTDLASSEAGRAP